jgi:hypothetical protein
MSSISKMVDRPFDGTIQVSPEPLMRAVAELEQL